MRAREPLVLPPPIMPGDGLSPRPGFRLISHKREITALVSDYPEATRGEPAPTTDRPAAPDQGAAPRPIDDAMGDMTSPHPRPDESV